MRIVGENSAPDTMWDAAGEHFSEAGTH